jgi:hypothetical protein
MKPAYILLGLAAVTGLSGCGSMRNALGIGKNVPDEFAVVSKAPLVVPPEYSLLPPRPGEPRADELNASAQARQALFGTTPSTAQSAGEQVLAAEAGGLSADPNIRAQIERETAGVVFKDESFADRILFWRGSDDVGLEADPLDPEAEAERLRRLESILESTGGDPVEIERSRGGGFNLPGL